MQVRFWLEHLNVHGDSSLGLDPAVVPFHATLVNLILCHQHLEMGIPMSKITLVVPKTSPWWCPKIHSGGAWSTSVVPEQTQSAEFPSQPSVQ